MLKGLQKSRVMALSWLPSRAPLNIGPLTALAAENNESTGNDQAAMAGPLTANPTPAKFDAGPFGKLTTTAALTVCDSRFSGISLAAQFADTDESASQIQYRASATLEYCRHLL